MYDMDQELLKVILKDLINIQRGVYAARMQTIVLQTFTEPAKKEQIEPIIDGLNGVDDLIMKLVEKL